MSCDKVKNRQVTHWDMDYLSEDQLDDLAEGRADADEVLRSAPLGEADEDSMRPPVDDTPDWRPTAVAAVVVGAITLVAWLFTIGPLG